MAMYARRPTERPWGLVLIAGLTVMLVIFLLFTTTAGRAGGDRTTPEPVHKRVVEDLQRNDARSLYAEMSPSFRELFSMETFLEGERTLTGDKGSIIEVQVVSPPEVKTGGEWNGEWADATLRIVRQTGVETYLVRFRRESGLWWLFGTLLIE